ncbi:ABC transporter substrate-binding protein [Lachnospiraceae bacterium 62-35]
MRKALRKGMAAAVVLMALLGMSACGKNSATEEGQPGGQAAVQEESGDKSEGSREFVYVSGVEPATMDVHLCTDANTSRILLQVHETLYKRDEDAEVIPLLAESATESEDGLSWVIKLKEGISFHDGTPFNAEAVKYSFDRLVNPDTGSAKASALANVESVEVLSDYEVKMNLKGKDLVFLASLTNYSTAIMSPEAGEKYGLGDYTNHPSGTGPLKMESWEPGIQMVLVKNENYWGEEPTVDKLIVKAIAEDSSRVMMIKTGDADVVAGIPPTLAQDLQNDSNVEMIIRPGYRTIFIGMNNGVSPFDDIRVRQAVNYAIDKKAIIDNVLHGLANYPSNGFESPAIQYAAESLDAHERDIEKAKALMKEAGYPDGFQTEIMTPEGRYPMDRQVAEVVQGMLAEIGIQAEVKISDWGAYQDALTAKNTKMFLLGKGSSTGDPEFDFLMHGITGGGQNHYQFSDSRVDDLLNGLSQAADIEERAEMLKEVQTIFNDACVIAPLYYENQFYAVRSNVSGIKIYPNELADLAWLTRN